MRNNLSLGALKTRILSNSRSDGNLTLNNIRVLLMKIVSCPLIQISEQWQFCHFQLLCLRWGEPSELGRQMDCAPNDLTAWRLEQGRVTVKTSAKDFTARAGEWLFLGNGHRKQEFSADARLTSVVFRAYWPDGHRPMFDLRPGFKLCTAYQLDAHIRNIREEVGNPPNYEWHFMHPRCNFHDVLLMEGWFRNWLSSAVDLWAQNHIEVKTTLEVDPRVEAARRWLMAQPVIKSLTDFSGAAVAAKLSMGHLNRLFLKYYQQSLYGFHEQRCIQYARQRLLEPQSKIKLVAHELGFRELSKFSTWFHRLEQMSPRKFRNQFRDTVAQ